MIFVAILEKITPIVFFLLLGVFFRRRSFFSESTITEIKQFLVNITLPALLFLTFLDLDFKREFLIVIVCMFGVNVIMLAAGKAVGRVLFPGNRYAPLMFTGFEMGMLGFSLFGISFGAEGLKAIGVLDLGQELYVWFVLTTLLMIIRKPKPGFKKIGINFITSPVILAILAGITINALVPKELIETLPGYTGMHTALSMLSNLTIPLILVIIGYQLRFHISGFAAPLLLLSIRIVLLLSFAQLMQHLVFPRLAYVPPLFVPALYTMALLPPPFIIPLFMEGASEEAHDFVSATLSLGTVITLVLYFVLLLICGR